MTNITVKLPKNLTMPVKIYLKEHCGLSATIWKRIKHSGTFAINGIIANATQSIVKNSDVISYDILRPSNIEPEDLPLDIRYEDDWLLIVNKPAGMLVHPTTKEPHGTLGNAVIHYYQQKNTMHAFHPVHRLDRDTSGLVLIAKEPQIQYKLSPKGQKLFTRDYLAIVKGNLTPPAGTINAPIARALPSIILRKAAPEGKPACTHYQTLNVNNGLSLIKLRLETGRTHQIRVHMAHIGHPLIGDDLYGGDLNIITRQALHAYQLQFIHPMSHQSIAINAPMPPDMSRVLSAFNLSDNNCY